MTIFEASPIKSAVPVKLLLPDRRKRLKAAMVSHSKHLCRPVLSPEGSFYHGS